MAENRRTGKYVIVDRNGQLVAWEPFNTERKAYEAKRVYEDNCTDIALPMRVVPEELSDDIVDDRRVPFEVYPPAPDSQKG